MKTILYSFYKQTTEPFQFFTNEMKSEFNRLTANVIPPKCVSPCLWFVTWFNTYRRERIFKLKRKIYET